MNTRAKNSSYHFLARFYEPIEKVVFRSALQNTRCAFIGELAQRNSITPIKVLTVGDGDGRFSEALLDAYPGIHLEAIEPDPAMRAQALLRCPALKFTTLETASPCDVVILNFVLDLFTEEDTHQFLTSLPGHQALIVSDFYPSSFLARAFTRLMYLCFRLTTGLKTTEVPPIHKILTSHGYQLTEEKTQWHGFIRAQHWKMIVRTTKPISL